MTGYETPPDNKETPKAGENGQAAATPPANPPPAQANNQEHLDDLGYEKTPAPQAGTKPPEAAKPPEKKPEAGDEKSVTGYEKEPEAVKPAEKPPEKKEGEQPPPSSEEFAIEEADAKEMLKEDIADIKDLVKDLKLSKEQGKLLIEKKKAEIKRLDDAWKKSQQEQVEAAKTRESETKHSWYKELKEHPEFGGDKFEHNLKQVDNVIKLLPELKNKLTETGVMLPPYVMRDLAKLASQVLANGSLNTQVNPPTTASSKANESDDPLDFYGKTS